MKALAELYLQQFKTTLIMMLQYRAALFIWMIGHVMEPLVYLVVWSIVSQSQGGSVGHYTKQGFAAYFIVLMLVNHLTYSWIMYIYEYRVRQGWLSMMLLKPMHPIHSDIADNVSAKLVNLPFMLVVAFVLTLIFKPAYTLVPWAVLAFIPAVVLAFLVRFLLEWTLAQAAFWITRTSAVNQIYYMLVLFFSGQIAPLELMPAPVRLAATWLPFRWMIGFPVELVLGRLSPHQALIGLAAQVLWLGVILVLLIVVWRRGLRVYTAVGA